MKKRNLHGKNVFCVLSPTLYINPLSSSFSFNIFIFTLDWTGIMSEQLTCGCKGVRFCLLCAESERVRNLKLLPSEPLNEWKIYHNYQKHVFCLHCHKAFQIGDISDQILSDRQKLFDIAADHSKHENDKAGLDLKGLLLISDFINEQEEENLMWKIDSVPWLLSQSGRRKQDYGPRVNFKHKRVKYDTFHGMPDYADFVLNRMTQLQPERLANYQPFELCNLEYTVERGSTIEFHIDDLWIWGNRLISVNLLDGGIMTFIEKNSDRMVLVPMPRRSLLCMADGIRYNWKHGILRSHIRQRRIALTMREPSQLFQIGGELYEKYGKDLIEIGNRRLNITGS